MKIFAQQDKQTSWKTKQNFSECISQTIIVGNPNLRCHRSLKSLWLNFKDFLWELISFERRNQIEFVELSPFIHHTKHLKRAEFVFSKNKNRRKSLLPFKFKHLYDSPFPSPQRKAIKLPEHFFNPKIVDKSSTTKISSRLYVDWCVCWYNCYN